MNVSYLIWRPDLGETIKDAYTFEVKGGWTTGIEDICADYAEVYYDHRDGWEAQWPIDFHIASDDEKYLGSVRVEMHSRPQFRGRILFGPAQEKTEEGAP